MEIIITDLTRFNNLDQVCIAGVDKNGVVYRPLPYIKASECPRLKIHPGGILKGKMKLRDTKILPHTEDADHETLTYEGKASSKDFRQALEATLYDSICDGFEIDPPNASKCIPVESPPVRSLITIKLQPQAFKIERDGYGKVKAHFTDNNQLHYSYIGVTDKGVFDNIINGDHTTEEVNAFIREQDELYLRIGLGRPFKAPDGRHGYWIQVNGIYTFPEYMKFIRTYE